MKKSWVAILAFLYITLSSGIVVNLHYCMGDLATVELGLSHDDTCGKCGMKDRKGCCETEYQVVKVQDAHQAAKDVQLGFFALPATVAVPAEPAIAVEAVQAAAYASYTPPDSGGNDLYIAIRVFRI